MNNHFSSAHGLGTIVTHATEGNNPKHAHVTPLYMTSTFSFPDVHTGADTFAGHTDGYIYTRIDHPNARQLAQKYAILEGLDLLKQNPDAQPEEIVAGRIFSTGMSAITSAILGRAKAGETIITQCSLYGTTHAFMETVAPRFGIKVVFLDDVSAEGWEKAFAENPEAVLAYVETPANPTMQVVDLEAVVNIAHAHDAWVMVDNTFATPYCQRPLTYGCDVVVHSTTKYLTGHGLMLGGAVITTQLDFLDHDTGELLLMSKALGGIPSPFDTWMANIGLKTFEVRMERHCHNAMHTALWLEKHPKIAQVYYPGLPNDPGHKIAQKQMNCGFSGMIAFELEGGFDAGVALMNNLKVITLAVSLGNVDSLISHPASMTHAVVPQEERLRAGLTDGLVRFSVGIENVEDLIADLDQALAMA